MTLQHLTRRAVLSAAAWILFVCLVSGQQPPAAKPGQTQTALPQTSMDTPSDYLVSRMDVISITLAEDPAVNGKYSVDTDGTILFPQVGRIVAAGLTVRQFEVNLRRQLVDSGFFLDPHLSVNLDQFRGRRVFVFGGVTAPGMYPLSENTTLLEILAKSGGSNAPEAVVVRSPTAIGPVMPRGTKPAPTIRVNLRELEKDVEAGLLHRNIFLEDSDTIYVPRIDRNRVFIMGEVKSPGTYSVPDGTTVLDVISQAGGVTDAASLGRIKIMRIEKGQKKSTKAKLTDVVSPGDTIIVPQRFF